MTTQNHNTLLIGVETWYKGQLKSLNVIDHNSREDRAWLGKHCFWAFRNDHAIITYPITEDYDCPSINGGSE